MFKKLTSQFEYKFSIKTDGLYTIEIEASCVAGKLFGLFGGQDLRVEINGIKFREIPAKDNAQYFNNPASWDGARLKGLSKKIIFILRLNQGDHRIDFFPKDGAIIEQEPKIAFLKENKLLLNTRAQDGDRRPWITIALIDMPLELLDVSVKCDQRARDSDDLKLVIDRTTQRNLSFGWWGKNWYWRGRRLQGQIEETRFYPRLERGIHYIEFWADRMPILNFVSIEFVHQEKPALPIFTIKDVKSYTANGTFKNEDYNKFDREIVEAVNKWNQEFFSQEYPPNEPLHPDLVKAMVYIESRVGYLETDPNAYPSYPDVMQVANTDNPAIHTLNRDGWIDKRTKNIVGESEWINGKETPLNYDGKANGATPMESIFWGTRWLYHVVQGITVDQKRYWRSWKEAVRLYNGQGDSNYVSSVYDAYLYGIDRRDKKHPIKLWSIIFVGLVLFASLLLFSGRGDIPTMLASQTEPETYVSPYGYGDPFSDPAPIRKLMDENMKTYANGDRYYYGDVFEKPFQLCKKDPNCAPDHIFPDYLAELVVKAPNMEALVQVLGSLDIISPGYYFLDDLDNDGQQELILTLSDYLNRDFIELSVIDRAGEHFSLVQTKVDRPYFDAPLKLIDLTKDAVPEIVLFTNGGRSDTQMYVFQYKNKSIQEVFKLFDGYWNADFIFTDQNHNRIPEIKIVGEKLGLMPFNFECMACQHMKIEEVFEYDPVTSQFRNMKAERKGVAGAFYRFIKDVFSKGVDQPLFYNWTDGAKDRFQISLKELRENGLQSLFTVLPGEQPIEEGDSLAMTLRLQRAIRLRDLAVRDNETREEENQRLDYFNNSPIYEAKFQKFGDTWQLTSFREQNH